jgi:hypothetical protein
MSKIFSLTKIAFIKNSKRSATYRTSEFFWKEQFFFAVFRKKARNWIFVHKIGFIKLFIEYFGFSPVGKGLFYSIPLKRKQIKFYIPLPSARIFRLNVGERYMLCYQNYFCLCLLTEEVLPMKKTLLALWCKSSFQM